MKVMQIDRKIKLVDTDEMHNKDVATSVAFYDRGQHQIGDEPHQRGYYLSAPPIRLLLILRGGVQIEDLQPGVYVQVKVGTDSGDGRPNLYRNQTHRKVSVFGVLPGPPDGGDVESFGDIVDTSPPHRLYRGGRRPLTPGENVRRQNVSLPGAVMDQLTALGGGNLSAGIRKLAEITEPPSFAVAAQTVDQICRILRVTPTKVQQITAARAVQEAWNAYYTGQRGA